MAYTLRPARPDDVPLLPEIERRAAALFLATAYAHLIDGDTVPLEVLAESQRAGRLWVAAQQATDRPVGFAMATLVDGQPHLQEMDVLPEHGRQGLGKRLIEAACGWATAQNHRRLTLTTFHDIPWNAPFYERLGFCLLPETAWTPGLRELMRHEEEIGLPMDRRVVMCRVLSGDSV